MKLESKNDDTGAKSGKKRSLSGKVSVEISYLYGS